MMMMMMMMMMMRRMLRVVQDSGDGYEICFVNGFDSYTADFIASS